MNQQRTRVFGHFLALLTVVAALGAAGCAGGKQASISGHVNYNGRPVTSGTVVLIGQDGKAAGYFSGTDDEQVKRLAAEATKLAATDEGGAK